MYRSEVEALRARVRKLESELTEARARNVKLEQRLDQILNPAPPPAPPAISALIRSAYRAAFPLVGLTAVGLLWAGARIFGFTPSLQAQPALGWIGALGWLFALVVATYFAGRPIQRVTGDDGGAMVFVTWFWLPFSLLFPGLGCLFALSRVVILLRGKFMSGTVTSGGTSTHWPAKEMHHREGWPAALVFTCILLIQPIVFLLMG